MNALLAALQLLVGALFVLLGLLALAAWLRNRETGPGMLSLAIGSLALVAVLGRLTDILRGGEVAEPLTDLAVAAFLLSGYALLRFRATFIPFGPWPHLAVAAGLAVTAVVVFAARLATTATPLAFQSAAVLLLILVWSACVVEPITRFWIASLAAPAVQRARLRALAAGFGGLVLVLLLAGAAPALARSIYVQVGIQVVAVGVVGLLYASFSPPSWLRRAWREPEEQRLRDAIQDLLLFSPSRRRLAELALEWAIRLVGAESGTVFDADGTALAAAGRQSEQAAGALAGADRQTLAPSVVRLEQAARRTAILLPLTLSSGKGALAVIGGPFTPYFGSDELERLRLYATAISAGLDRAILTERLTALERTKSEFLNLASHELRGPVTLVRGYLSMLKGGSLGEVSPQLARVLPILQARTDEMNSMIEQMLETARLEEGRMQLNPVESDLRQLAERAVEAARPLADQRHRLLLQQPDSELRATVDPERVVIIIANLVSNAIKYSPRGGEIHCSLACEDGSAVVEVSDEGVGIPHDQMDRLFTKFGRVSDPRVEGIPGTGLGLYLSRQLAIMHGGDITVRSEPGRGSRFRLVLPLETS